MGVGRAAWALKVGGRQGGGARPPSRRSRERAGGGYPQSRKPIPGNSREKTAQGRVGLKSVPDTAGNAGRAPDLDWKSRSATEQSQR